MTEFNWRAHWLEVAESSDRAVNGGLCISAPCTCSQYSATDPCCATIVGAAMVRYFFKPASYYRTYFWPRNAEGANCRRIAAGLLAAMAETGDLPND